MKRELITFVVHDQVFALDIMSIREIRAWTPTTKLPRMPRHVAGVVNLRGTVLPVIDLAARLGWETAAPTSRHAIIVTKTDDNVCGLIVDSVSDIVTIGNDSLQSPPLASRDAIATFVEGLAAIDDQMVQVLDLRAVVGAELAAAA